MKSIWQKIFGFFSKRVDLPEIETKEELSDEIIQKFISNPETFTLYRGEGGRQANENGLHFTTDKEWAKRFGSTILVGTLPKRMSFLFLGSLICNRLFRYGSKRNLLRTTVQNR